MTAARDVYPRWTRVASTLGGGVLAGAMYAGTGAALVGWSLGLALVLGAVASLFLLHLGIGIVGYRRAMASEWPRVAPIEDDDWD